MNERIMNNPDTELLFPMRVVPTLEKIRGKEWEELVENILGVNTSLLDQLAFVLTIVRLAGCVSCSADSFRAIRGCTHCSAQAVRRFRGTDADLIKQFVVAKGEVEEYLLKKKEKLHDRSIFLMEILQSRISNFR
ncbi:MAG: hypothetical protein MUO76_16840 [Anaerolineaceae bacterium]|nr:hypothetical protein [Anaerolineaceae bacterium]